MSDLSKGLLLKIFQSYLLFQLTFQTCSFTQYCSDNTNTSTCVLPVASTYEPFTYNSTEIICPEFVNKPVCCNGGQNLLMSSSF